MAEGGLSRPKAQVGPLIFFFFILVKDKILLWRKSICEQLEKKKTYGTMLLKI